MWTQRFDNLGAVVASSTKGSHAFEFVTRTMKLLFLVNSDMQESQWCFRSWGSLNYKAVIRHTMDDFVQVIIDDMALKVSQYGGREWDILEHR